MSGPYLVRLTGDRVAWLTSSYASPSCTHISKRIPFSAGGAEGSARSQEVQEAQRRASRCSRRFPQRWPTEPQPAHRLQGHKMSVLLVSIVDYISFESCIWKVTNILFAYHVWRRHENRWFCVDRNYSPKSPRVRFSSCLPSATLFSVLSTLSMILLCTMSIVSVASTC